MRFEKPKGNIRHLELELDEVFWGNVRVISEDTYHRALEEPTKLRDGERFGQQTFDTNDNLVEEEGLRPLFKRK